MARTTKKQEQERNEAIETLRKFGVEPGATVYTSCTRVARSGMSRLIHVYIVCQETNHGVTKPEIQEITGLVGVACDVRRDDRDGGLKVGGCGMDMGFHTVYNLGRVMFPKGGPLAKSGHVRQSQAKRAGVKTEVDGGYLLNHRWL